MHASLLEIQSISITSALVYPTIGHLLFTYLIFRAVLSVVLLHIVFATVTLRAYCSIYALTHVHSRTCIRVNIGSAYTGI